jgi:hypothetical protein
MNWTYSSGGWKISVGTLYGKWSYIKIKMDPRQLGQDNGRQIEMAQDYMEDILLYELCWTCRFYLPVLEKFCFLFQVEEDKKPRIDLQNLAKRRKKRRPSVKLSNDECFICGEGGELLLCDNKTCPKGYHLQCLKLERFPHGENCIYDYHF